MQTIFIRVWYGKKTPAITWFCLTVLFFTSLPFTVVAKEDDNLYFKTLQNRLIADGFDSQTITELYHRRQVRFEKKGITSFLAHREARLNYNQFLSSRMIEKARQYIKTHRAVLMETEKNYGVDKEVITAIILVETRLGATLGGPSVLNTLSSMAALDDAAVREKFWQEHLKAKKIARKRYEQWVAKKSHWAYGELKAFLEHTAREKLDPLDIKGSYAGAMGIAQFMPSNISAFAQDGNGDGRIDLFNHADAIASVAGYLKHYGWRPGIDQKKAYQVVLRYNYSSPYAKTVLKIASLLKGQP